MSEDHHPPAKYALILSVGGFAFSLITILHLRVDRTTRITRLTWHGPLSEYIGWLGVAAFVLASLSMWMASGTPIRWRNRSTAFGCVTALFAILTFALLFSIVGRGED